MLPQQLIKEATDYMDTVLWLDPIGSSDIRGDFIQYLHTHHTLTQTIPHTWEKFNTEILQPIYKISIPPPAE